MLRYDNILIWQDMMRYVSNMFGIAWFHLRSRPSSAQDEHEIHLAPALNKSLDTSSLPFP